MMPTYRFVPCRRFEGCPTLRNVQYRTAGICACLLIVTSVNAVEPVIDPLRGVPREQKGGSGVGGAGDVTGTKLAPKIKPLQNRQKATQAQPRLSLKQLVPADPMGRFLWRPGSPLKTVEPLLAPSWKKKKYYKKIVEDQAIIFSVTTSKLGKIGRQKRLLIAGGGHIRASQMYSHLIISDFNNLKKMAAVFKEVKYSPKTGRLYLHCEAFGYHARMLLQVAILPGKEVSEIRWRHVAGVFRGMTGVLQFSSYKRHYTEISMTAAYEFVKLPIPKFFIEFGLEVVFQKMGARIRRFVEASKSKSN